VVGATLLAWMTRRFAQAGGALSDDQKCAGLAALHVAPGRFRRSGAMYFQKWAVSLASARSADVVVTGHTHVPLRVEHPGALFLNSGSCSMGRFSFLSLDTRRGAYVVQNAWA
jgi:hypothetical protein